jgi:hypothetical protein
LTWQVRRLYSGNNALDTNSWAYFGGSAAGIASSFLLGFGAGNAIAQGTRFGIFAGRAAQAYTAVSIGWATGNSAVNFYQGDATVFDGLAFVPAAGFLSNKVSSLAARAKASGSGLSRGAQLRQKFGSQLDEYMHFRGQGFTPAQSKYLTQPYGNRAGHHFPIPQRTGRDWNISRSIIDSRFNVLRPKDISIGRFYELHYRVDPFFHGTRFPKAIGGTWRGSQLGLERYSGIQKLWYSTPGPTKVVGGVGLGAGAAGAAYWWLSDDSE